jgi:hypothetical protein
MSGKFYVGISVLVCGVAFMSLALAQNSSPITGQWTISGPVFQDHVMLHIQCCNGGRSNMNTSSALPLSQLRGLDRGQFEAAGVIPRFEIARDAGTFRLQGFLQNGSGGGVFTFSPNPNFVTEMRALGFSNLSDETVFVLAMHDISAGFVRDMNALGIRPDSTNELVSMGIHGVTVDFVRDLQGLGYSSLSPTKLVTMRIHGVTTDFARQLKAMGYSSVSTDQMVTMRIHGVSTDFIKEIEALGYNHPRIESLVTMRIHGITPEFINRTRSRGMGNLTIDQLVSLKIHGVMN